MERRPGSWKVKVHTGSTCYSIREVFAVLPYCSYFEAEMSWKVMDRLRWRQEGLSDVQLSAYGRQVGDRQPAERELDMGGSRAIGMGK